MKENKIGIYTLLLLTSAALVFFSQHNCFFWDNKSQLSIPAIWFYENGLSTLFLPDAIATGHPSTFGIYIALTWKLFGFSLSTAHWAMLPFIFGFLVQSYLLLKQLFSNATPIALGILLLITDACILSQSTLVTFELPHIFFFLLAVNAVFSNKRNLLLIATTALCLISLRATMSCAGLLIFDFLLHKNDWKSFLLKRMPLYIPGFLFIATYLGIHYLQRGWAVHNTASGAWEQSAQFASFTGMLRNIVVLAVRIFEYGRFILIPIFVMMLWNNKEIIRNPILKKLLLAVFTQMLIFFPVVIVYQNPFSTRYFLPIIILLILTSLYYIVNYLKKPFLIAGAVILANIGGWFIVYPQQISMPWDATPAHWPYYSLREQMFTYLETEKIPLDSISGGFNIYGNQVYTDLKRTGFIEQEPTRKYYVHTNISNPTDLLLAELRNPKKWFLIKRTSHGGVFFELYKRL